MILRTIGPDRWGWDRRMKGIGGKGTERGSGGEEDVEENVIRVERVVERIEKGSGWESEGKGLAEVKGIES